MERRDQVILTNMCMIRDGSKVLVEEKMGRGVKGIIFPGGHVERHEPIVDSVIREVKEETGLTIQDPKLCGIKEWIEEDGSRYMVFLFRASRFTGELTSSSEGRVFWVKKEDAARQPLASGVAPMLEVFFGDFPREIFWRNGVPEIL